MTAVSVDVVVMQAGWIPDFLQETIAGMIAFLPRLIGALLILLIGWFLGRIVAKIVQRLTDAVELDRMTLGTPLGRMLGGSERAVSRAFGKIAAYYIYFLAILAAADVLAIAVLSEWVNAAVSYLPAFIAGLLIIVVGFILADFIGDAIERTAGTTTDQYRRFFADGVRMFLYFIAIVVGLDTMGVNVEILYIFGGALAFGLALAIAIGAGLAFGLGSREHVRENIDRWTDRASDAAGDDSGSRSVDDDSGSRSVDD